MGNLANFKATTITEINGTTGIKAILVTRINAVQITEINLFHITSPIRILTTEITVSIRTITAIRTTIQAGISSMGTMSTMCLDTTISIVQGNTDSN